MQLGQGKHPELWAIPQLVEWAIHCVTLEKCCWSGAKHYVGCNSGMELKYTPSFLGAWLVTNKSLRTAFGILKGNARLFCINYIKHAYKYINICIYMPQLHSMFYPVTYKQIPTGHPHLCFKPVDSRLDLVLNLCEKFSQLLRVSCISQRKRKTRVLFWEPVEKLPKHNCLGDRTQTKYGVILPPLPFLPTCNY